MNSTDDIPGTDVRELLSQWWITYDAGDVDALEDLLTSDARWRCRSDSGASEYEEHVRADEQGRDEVMTWQRGHRLATPSPIRHHLTNFCITGRDTSGVTFTGYLLANTIQSLAPQVVSTATVTGRVRLEERSLKFCDLEVAVDLTDSASPESGANA